jgi:hypothetical protein
LIEFGSGLSTLVIARLIRSNKIKSKLISVENDKKWMEIVKNALKGEGLEECVSFVHAPLKRNGNTHWYDEEKLSAIRGKYDLVLIDGPEAWRPKDNQSRFGAIRYMRTRLANSYSIFLDDADRYGEKQLIKKSGKLYKIYFRMRTRSLAQATEGSRFNISI